MQSADADSVQTRIMLIVRWDSLRERLKSHRSSTLPTSQYQVNTDTHMQCATQWAGSRWASSLLSSTSLPALAVCSSSDRASRLSTNNKSPLLQSCPELISSIWCKWTSVNITIQRSTPNCHRIHWFFYFYHKPAPIEVSRLRFMVSPHRPYSCSCDGTMI